MTLDLQCPVTDNNSHRTLQIKCHLGHAATKPDKVNIGITKDFRDQNLVM